MSKNKEARMEEIIPDGSVVFHEGRTVRITTKEYRELITEMVEHRKDAEHEKLLRWKAETEVKELKEELALAHKRIMELEHCVVMDKEVTNNG